MAGLFSSDVHAVHAVHAGNACFRLPVCQVTPARCRKTSSTKDGCSSPTTGSASTPKCSAKTPRWRRSLENLNPPWFCCFPPDAVTVCQIAIPVMSVTHIKKTKTAILVPNALVIATANDKVRRSPSSRKTRPRNARSGILRQGDVGYLTGWFFCAVRLCVLPVPRQHLQDPDVHLSSSGGRTDVRFVGVFLSHRL